MTVYYSHLYTLFLLLQTLLYILLLVLILCFYLYKKRVTKKKERLFSEFKKWLANELMATPKKCPFPSCSKNSEKQALIDAMESIENNIQTDQWEHLKLTLVKQELSGYINSFRSSLGLERKVYIAKVMALAPKSASLETLSLLFKEKSFYLRTLAAKVSSGQADPSSLKLMLEAMKNEHSTAHFAYKHAIALGKSNCSAQLATLLEKIPQKDALRAPCLELLSVIPPYKLPHTVQKDLVSSDESLRFLGYQLLAKYPHQENLSLFKKGARDPSWRVKIEAIKGLALLPFDSGALFLESLLEEERWDVRLAAAKALYTMGTEGTDLLKKQESSLNPLGHDVARYVLTVNQ